MDWSFLVKELVVPAVLTLGAWAWARVTGKREEKKESRSILDDIVENFIYEQLDRYPLNVDVETYLKGSRAYIEKYVWTVASKRGIPRNKATEALLHAAIERGTKILAREITELRKIREQQKHELELKRGE